MRAIGRLKLVHSMECGQCKHGFVITKKLMIIGKMAIADRITRGSATSTTSKVYHVKKVDRTGPERRI